MVLLPMEEEEMTKAIHHLMVIGKAVGMKKRLKRILDGALLSIGINIYHFILCVHELETI
jgi:hypothetical protein